MTRTAANAWKILRLLPRAALLVLLLAAPVMAMNAMRADNGSMIEAPVMKNTGAGFVLLVSLQRG